MSDWDASSADEAPAAASKIAIASTSGTKKKWEDEDADSDDLKDDWDASEDEDSKTNQPVQPAGPIRKKGITKQKIAEKEAAEQAKLEAKAAALALDNDPEAKRKAARERELKADLENARSLFGDDAVDAVGSTSDDPFSSNPITKEDFDAVATQLSDLIHSKFSSKPLYPTFIDSLVKSLCTPLRDLEVRKTSSTLNTLANEKQKQAKDAAGGGKKKGAKRPALGAAKGVAKGVDTRMYDEALDDSNDFDDFM